MNKKVTWNIIREDFKRRYPKLNKEVMYWRPHDYATIFIRFKDLSEGLYNYDEHRFTFTNLP